jgi:hypothetical protein
MPSVNFLAVIASSILSLILGFLWYGNLFRDQWLKYSEVKFAEGERPTPAAMVKSITIFFVSALFTSYVFGLGLEIWRHFLTEPKWLDSLYFAVIVWIGFFIPFQTGRVSWEKKSWNLVFINGSFDLIRLLLTGLIFWFWV